MKHSSLTCLTLSCFNVKYKHSFIKKKYVNCKRGETFFPNIAKKRTILVHGSFHWKAHIHHQPTLSLMDSTLERMNCLTAATYTARRSPVVVWAARRNLTASPFWRKSRLSARLVMLYGYVCLSASSGSGMKNRLVVK